MKTYLLFLPVLFVMTVSVKAQLKAGDNIVGPSFHFGFLGQDTKTSTNTGFNIGIGGNYLHLKSARHGVGFRLATGISANRSKNNFTTDNTSNNSFGTAFDIFRRNYFPLVNRIYFHLEYGVGMNWTRDKYNPDGTIIRRLSLNSYLTPGFSYITRKKIILEGNLSSLVALGFQRSKSSQDNYSSSHDILHLNSNLFQNAFLSNISIKWIIGK